MKQDPAPAEALLLRLDEANAASGPVRFDPAGPRGARRGTVETERDASGAVILRERGRFRFDDGREIPYTDALRFERSGGAVEVSHLRRGPGRPTGLVRLEPRGDGTLVSAAPHRCGADEYALAAWVGRSAVTLEWAVRGPRKRGSIRIMYMAGATESERASDPRRGAEGPASTTLRQARDRRIARTEPRRDPEWRHVE